MRAAQGRKGTQQAQITCVITANHKATGPTATIPCHHTYFHASVHSCCAICSTDTVRPPDPCATQRAAQGCKEDQQVTTAIRATTNLKATGPTATTRCCQVTMHFHCATCTTDATRLPDTAARALNTRQPPTRHHLD
jgi:hypothetical protein